MPQAKSLRDLMLIRAHNMEYLESINGNLGTALGFKKPTNRRLTNIPAILVFVPQKINPKWIPKDQIIPKKLKGPDDLWCLLDVVEGGQAEEEEEFQESPSELAERLRGWDDQVWAGSQISYWENQRKQLYSVGTISAFVKEQGTNNYGLLTNQHVANKVGQKLYHPVPWGTHIATTRKVIKFVEDEDWYGIDESKTYVRVDCAFAEIEPSFTKADINTRLMGVGKLGPVKEISLDDMSIIGKKVLRVGATSGITYGTVVAFGYEYSDEDNESIYTDLLIIGDNDKPFSIHGDSGSIIVTNNKSHNPIGMLWGGWTERLRTGHAQENWSYATTFLRICNILEVSLI